MDRLRAEVRFDGETAHVVLHGDLDMWGAQTLNALVTEFDRIARIDLSDVDTIDSSGLFALVQADTRARLSGTRLALVPPKESVGRIFEWTGLDTRLTFLVAA